MKTIIRRGTTLSVAFFLMWCTSTLRLFAALGDRTRTSADLVPTIFAVLLGAWVVADRIARRPR